MAQKGKTKKRASDLKFYKYSSCRHGLRTRCASDAIQRTRRRFRKQTKLALSNLKNVDIDDIDDIPNSFSVRDIYYYHF